MGIKCLISQSLRVFGTAQGHLFKFLKSSNSSHSLSLILSPEELGFNGLGIGVVVTGELLIMPSKKWSF